MHRQETLPEFESIRAPKAGIFKNKGKTIDPHEWGNLDLNEEDIDIQAQKAALESYKLTLAQKKRELKENALNPAQRKNCAST